ncbi:unnamed protein product [Orchesella dallaii]|uniref:Chromo domain-containing protein n=1 Tax=Orchesella dallaii TaxID=48710 RepID=A0ABP1QJP9_9HEXA
MKCPAKPCDEEHLAEEMEEHQLTCVEPWGFGKAISNVSFMMKSRNSIWVGVGRSDRVDREDACLFILYIVSNVDPKVDLKESFATRFVTHLKLRGNEGRHTMSWTGTSPFIYENRDTVLAAKQCMILNIDPEEIRYLEMDIIFSSMASHPQPSPNDNGQGQLYAVDRVIRKKKGDDGKPIYLIKWTGYPMDESTWEPEENLTQALITDFHKREAGKRRRNRQMRTGTLPTEQMEMPDGGEERMQVEEIRDGLKDMNGDRFYLAKLMNVNEPVLIPTGVAETKFPDAVMKFHEEKYDWAPLRNAKSSCIIM